MAAAVQKIGPATDPLIRAIGESTAKLEAQKAVVRDLAEGLGSVESSSAAAASSQERLQAALVDTTRIMVSQGVEAVRVSEKIGSAQRGQVASAREAQRGLLSHMGGMLPFAAPEGAHVWREAIGQGETLDNVMARLTASNLATPEEIAKARADYANSPRRTPG